MSDENQLPLPGEAELSDGYKTMVVGIGASAGGIKALRSFFERVTAGSGMAYVVILHLSPHHDSQLREVLALVAKIPVTKVVERTKVETDHIYVISPNHHLMMEDGHIEIFENQQVEDRRAPVDIFFRALAHSHGPSAVAVILSGSGANGSMGLKRVKELGGAVYVQEPAEAEFQDMPRNAIDTQLVDAILPVEEIPGQLLAYKKGLGKVRLTAEAESRPKTEQEALSQIFAHLRTRTGHDFANYKRPTLMRRIERRITVKHASDITAYAQMIKDQPDESRALLKDLLISVTNFFRDKKAFQYLEAEIIPAMLHGKSAEDQLRIWVPGCATGEEAYTIAMLVAERTLSTFDSPKVQIFATDIDEDALTIARDGLYSLNDAADISPERLRRFFSKEGKNYRIRREVKELILFANHNFLKDPPFANLDLISCRNVMIYLNRTAQARTLETFHFALGAGKFLFLGNSESVDAHPSLYEHLSRDFHSFKSRPATIRSYPVPESIPVLKFDSSKIKNPAVELKPRKIFDRSRLEDLHHRLLETYAPPSIVVDDQYDILHVTDNASAYLVFSSGEPSPNILKNARPEIRLELRTALYQAVQQKQPVEVRDISIFTDGIPQVIHLHVRPVLRNAEIPSGIFLILFEKAENVEYKELVVRPEDSVSLQLEEELVRVKQQLVSSHEHHEFQAEELKASNEELQAMNEEMRSAGEELETSREELQSMNEELKTVNQELKIKIEETSLSSNNLQNLINSTSIATLFLDRSLLIALFTPAALELFNLIGSDIGRPVTDITHRLNYHSLAEDAEKVIEKLSILEQEVTTSDERFFLMRISPYRTSEDMINGVVVTFIDITARKRSEGAVKESERKLRHFIHATSDAVFTLSADGSVIRSDYGNDFIGTSTTPISQWILQRLPEDERERFANQYLNAIKTTSVFELEHKIIKLDGSQGWSFTRAVPVIDETQKTVEWFGTAANITARKRSEEALIRSEERFRSLSESGLIGISFFDTDGRFLEANETFLRITSFESQEFAARIKSWPDLITEACKPAMIKALIDFRDHNFFTPFQCKIRTGSDGDKWVLLGATRFLDRNDGLAFMLDIDDLKALEHQKDEFIAVASHELKTPVTALNVYVEVLQDRLGEAKADEQRNIIEKLSTQVKRINNLIHTLLDTTKIVEGKLLLHPEHFALEELLTEVVGDWKSIAPNRTCHLKTVNGVNIYADRERIREVLHNLLSNAIKYSPDNSEINLSAQPFGDFVKISVRDRGMGIPKEMLDKVFERFFRILNPKGRGYPGMGLGLYISAGIVQQHGGNISVESTEELGSIFHFTLPVAAAIQ